MDKESKRTIKADGEKIKRLRAEKGWNVTELAGHVGCSPRTVNSIESGKPCYVFTLSNFAEALGVECAELIEKEVTEPSPVRVAAEIRVNILKEFFDETNIKGFLETISAIINARYGIEIQEIKIGSVVYIVSIVTSDLYRLLAAFHDGLLSSLSVVGIRLIDCQLPFEHEWRGNEHGSSPLTIEQRPLPPRLPGSTDYSTD